MGDGVVLEAGNHDDLLARGGAYHRLVQAQKLREQAVGDDTYDATDERGADMDKMAREEIPLGRKNTGRSLASEILDQKNQGREATKKEGDHSLFYLFMRMGKLNHEGWTSYSIGGFFAIRTFNSSLVEWALTQFPSVTGMVYPAFGIVYGKAVDGFSAPTKQERRFEGDRNALWCVGFCSPKFDLNHLHQVLHYRHSFHSGDRDAELFVLLCSYDADRQVAHAELPCHSEARQ